MLDALGVLPRVDGPEGEGVEASLPAGPVHVLASAFCGEKAFELIGERAAVDDAWRRLARRCRGTPAACSARRRTTCCGSRPACRGSAPRSTSR